MNVTLNVSSKGLAFRLFHEALEEVDNHTGQWLITWSESGSNVFYLVYNIRMEDGSIKCVVKEDFHIKTSHSSKTDEVSFYSVFKTSLEFITKYREGEKYNENLPYFKIPNHIKISDDTTLNEFLMGVKPLQSSNHFKKSISELIGGRFKRNSIL